ncbi:MAG: Ribosome maturation factor RimM [Syntrophomonadaceae bacterium]|nr:Ribosome maturation factor RimM [Bacillota bacterium]
MTEMAVIGKIVKPHGIHGELKVRPYSDFPERVRSLTRVFLETGGTDKAYQVRDAFVHGRFWVLSLVGVSTPEAAGQLKGVLLKIPLSERVPLPEGTYYLDELIGLQVYTVTGMLLGTVSEILQTGSNDVYVVDRADSAQGAGQLLIPALKAVVVKLEPALKRMEVVLPEGLL